MFLLLAAGIILPALWENPEDLQALLKNAERDLDWRFFEEAERSYLEILQRYPQSSSVNEALGYICLMQQKYDESFVYLEKELEREPDNELARLLLTIAHFQAGNAPVLREMIQQVGNISKKKTRKKHPFFKKFLGDNPGLLSFVKGILYKQLGEWAYAEEMMDEAAREKYNLAEIMVQLVDQYLQQQNSAAAELMLSKLERRNFQLAEQMSEIVKTRDLKKAREYARSRPIIIRYFKESITTIVDDLNAMAQNAVKRADPQGAIKSWLKALYADDKRFAIHYNIALIYCLYKFPQESLYHCRRAIDLGNPQYQSWALNLAGNITFEMGDLDQALKFYQEALDLTPDYLKCRNNLGHTYWKLGDLPNAERQWRIVIENSGSGGKELDVREWNDREKIKVLVDVKESDEIVEAGKSLAALYIQQKQAVKAIPLLKMVLQFIPSDADSHFELGRIHMQLDRMELARQHLETAIVNGTTFETEAGKLLVELAKMIE
ncbi:MAG TPA: tetratricopeptide repeat protein [Patescibacteria group bacterium]|nr:tetratricopeptide repeat protein [Patescibacteria group bacterium]